MSENNYEVRAIRLSEITDDFVESWAVLEQRAVEANVFLSPDFVLPALRHLDPEISIFLFAVFTKVLGASQLVALGVFVDKGSRPGWPLRRLVAYRSKHSYGTGMLIDKDHCDNVLDCILGKSSGAAAIGDYLEFPVMRSDGPLFQAWDQALRRIGRRPRVVRQFLRAKLEPESVGPEYSLTALGRRKLKELQRLRRRLEEKGQVTWRFIDGSAPELRAATQRFLNLENLGWKQSEGTSLMADVAGAAFANEMAFRFGSSGRIFFTELLVNELVIASTLNFLSGDEGFAFKVGWDPAYSKFSVGMINELGLVEAAPTVLANISVLDSCSEAGSFIEHLWSGRRRMASVQIPITNLGNLTLMLLGMYTHIRNGLRNLSGMLVRYRRQKVLDHGK